ncbi:hypothetical protein HLB10_18980, partial [Cellulomonas fimi]|nr:hypothetical protein [Cellulomonas fimi]
MSEPGERRRRRELERAAEQDASMSSPSRRAMREQVDGPPGVPSWSAAATEAESARSRRSVRDTSLDPTSAPRPGGQAQPAAPAWPTATSRPAAPTAPPSRPAQQPPSA